MSRAFVKEDVEVADALPERTLSPHRNFVTASGLQQIDDAVAKLRVRLHDVTAAGEQAAVAGVSRDLRYWLARRASAELVEQPATVDTVRFGSTVVIERDDGRRQTFRIVGEDEADPARGTLSYVSPLARAVTGKAAGDEVALGGGDLTIIEVN